MDKDAIIKFEENNYDTLFEKYCEKYEEYLTRQLHWMEFVMDEYNCRGNE